MNDAARSEEIENTSTKYRQFLVLNWKLISLISFIVWILLVILVIIILQTRSANTNSSDDISQNQNNVSPESPDDSSLLETGICPDELQFSPSLMAKYKGEDYLVTEAALNYINQSCPNTKIEGRDDAEKENTRVPWSYDGSNWKSTGEVSECKNPLEIMTPVDISLVSGMLYPGQVRGTHYKAHGGFAFDNQNHNRVTVKLPEDSVLWRAVGYIQDGEVQYLLDFMSECGIAYRFDHLLTLSDELAQIMSKLPEPTEGTLTHFINPPVQFKKGDVIATEVGFRNTLNVGFDFGVYDLRQRNHVAQTDPAWVEAHKQEAEYSYFAICWLDNLEGNDKVVARSLKARGAYGDEGKESDYCK